MNPFLCLIRPAQHRVYSTPSDKKGPLVADAHRGDGKRYVVQADEKLTAFLELESAIRGGWPLTAATG
jgi:hypothetical protein